MQAVDAYAIVGDIIGLAEKIQSFFMQEVLSGTHLALRDIVLEVVSTVANHTFMIFHFFSSHLTRLSYMHFFFYLGTFKEIFEKTIFFCIKETTISSAK